MWDTGGKVSYTFPSCVPVDFPASDANSAHSPLAEFCVPCVPSGTGTKKTFQSQFPQNQPKPTCLAPRRPRVAEQAMACSGRNPRVRRTRLFLSEKHRVSPPREGLCGEFTPQVGERPASARSGAGLGPTGASLVEVTGEAGKQENHFHFSASLRLETKHTVVSNPHNPPLWGGQAERLPDVVGRHKRRAEARTHFCRKERSL